MYQHPNNFYNIQNKYSRLIINGINQNKILLLHFFFTPKNLQEENFIQFDVVSYMAINEKIYPTNYFTIQNIHTYSNLSITIIHHLLSH